MQEFFQHFQPKFIQPLPDICSDNELTPFIESSIFIFDYLQQQTFPVNSRLPDTTLGTGDTSMYNKCIP